MPSIFPQIQWLRERHGTPATQDFALAVEDYLTLFTDEWLAVTGDNRLLPDAFVCTHDCKSSVYMGNHRRDGRMELRLPAQQYFVEEPLYVLGGTVNYAHWVFDVLPRLGAWKASRELGALKILVDKDLKKFHLDWLEVLGVPHAALAAVPYPATVVCRQAVYPSIRTDTRYGAPIRNAAQLDWVRNAVPRLAEPAGRRLYITRGLNDTSKRRIANEEAIIALATRHGFEVHDTDGMSVRDQIALFQSAGIVLSVHGAALANTAVSAPGTAIVELVNDALHKTYLGTGWFARSAAMLGHHYIRVVGAAGPANAADERPVNRVGTFDVDAVESAIVQAAEHATAPALASQESHR